MSESTTCTCELYVIVDVAGDYACGNTPECARQAFEDEVGELGGGDGFRTIRLLVTVPLPETVTLTGTAPAQGEASLAVASA